MRFEKIEEDTYFEIVELSGKYKVDHDKRVVKAYSISDTGRISNLGVVKGLYESLLAGRWRIK